MAIKELVQENMAKQLAACREAKDFQRIAARPRIAAPARLPHPVTRSRPIFTTRHSTGELPDTALKASLGCGNPTSWPVSSRRGRVGSWFGRRNRCDLSAKRVGPKVEHTVSI